MDSPSSSDDADSRPSALIIVEEPAGLHEKFIISMFLNIGIFVIDLLGGIITSGLVFGLILAFLFLPELYLTF